MPLICSADSAQRSLSGVIGKTVIRIASATGIGYRHNRSMRFSNIFSSVCIKQLICH